MIVYTPDTHTIDADTHADTLMCPGTHTYTQIEPFLFPSISDKLYLTYIAKSNQ